MPIVDCPACGRETFVLFRDLGERKCQSCGQSFWTTLSAGRAGVPPHLEPAPPQVRTGRFKRTEQDTRV